MLGPALGQVVSPHRVVGVGLDAQGINMMPSAF
jgi:hypothetical protein